MFIGNQSYFTKTNLLPQTQNKPDITFQGKGKSHKWVINTSELPVISEDKDLTRAYITAYERRFSNIVKRVPPEGWKEKLLPNVTEEAKNLYNVTTDTIRIKKQAFKYALSEYFTRKEINEIFNSEIPSKISIKNIATKRRI